MLVDIVYPAPLVHAPKGSRKERLGFTEMRVSTRLREAERTDIVEVGRFRSTLTADATTSLYAFDDALWQAVRVGGGGRGSAIDLAEFLGGDRRDGRLAIQEHFVRTPLGFATLGIGPQGPSDPARSRSIVFDGRAGAEARVIEFAASDLLIAGGEAFARTRPVLTSGDSRRALPMTQELRINPGLWRTFELRTGGHPYACHPFQYFVASPDDADGHWAFLDQHHAGSPFRHAKGGPPAHGLPKGLHGDGDISLLANTLPELVIGDVADAFESLPRDTDVGSPRFIALRQAMADLTELSALGNVGGVPLRDTPRVIERVLGYLRLAGETVRSPAHRGRLDAFETWYQTLGASRLAQVVTTPAADLEAVAGLAP